MTLPIDEPGDGDIGWKIGPGFWKSHVGLRPDGILARAGVAIEIEGGLVGPAEMLFVFGDLTVAGRPVPSKSPKVREADQLTSMGCPSAPSIAPRDLRTGVWPGAAMFSYSKNGR